MSDDKEKTTTAKVNIGPVQLTDKQKLEALLTSFGIEMDYSEATDKPTSDVLLCFASDGALVRGKWVLL